MLPEQRYAGWRPMPTRRWVAQWFGFGAGAVTFGVVTLLMGSPNYAVIMVSGFAASYLSGVARERQTAGLRDDPEGGQFAVSLVVSREVTYGYDEGLVSFEEGWLIYSGRRCVFSFPVSAVRDIGIDKKSLTFSFGPDDDQRTATLSIASNVRFLTAAKAWQSAQETDAQSVVLPPLTVNETAVVAHRSLVALTGLATCILLLAVPFLQLLRGVTYFVAWAVVAAMGVYLLNESFKLRVLMAGHPRRLPFWRRPIGVRRRQASVLPSDIDSK